MILRSLAANAGKIRRLPLQTFQTDQVRSLSSASGSHACLNLSRAPRRLYPASRSYKVHASQKQQHSLVRRAVKTCGRLVRWILRLAAVSALLAAALPSLLSTGPGLKAGTSIASHFFEGDIDIQKAELGWLKPIHLTGVSYNQPVQLGGQPLAMAESLNTKSRLWDVVVGRQYDVYGEKPWLDCTFSDSGQWKWAELSKHAAGKIASSGNAQLSETKSQSSLVQETAEINFSAEARLLTASVYFPNGVMKVPREVKEVIGKNLHMIALLGKSGLKEAAEEFDLDLTWADASEQRGESMQSGESSGGESSGEGSRPSARTQGDPANKARLSSWFGWETVDPGVVEIRSENLRARADGWRKRSDSTYLLNGPGRLEFTYTTALAKYVLGRLSPLLSGVLAVDNGVVGVDVTPQGLISPADSYHFRIDPLRIAIQRQGLLKSAIDFLRLKKSWAESATLLQGATSAIHVDVDDDGSIQTQRLDLLVSPGSRNRGVHLCSWGEIKPTQDRINLNLGVPASTLGAMGLTGALKDDVLVVPLKGTFTRPSIDWRGAYSRLSALAANRAGEPRSLRGAILQGVARGIDQRLGSPDRSADLAKAPEPVEPLPWEDNDSILDDTVEAGET